MTTSRGAFISYIRHILSNIVISTQYYEGEEGRRRRRRERRGKRRRRGRRRRREGRGRWRRLRRGRKSRRRGRKGGGEEGEVHSHKHKCTLTMVGKLICTGYASPSLMFSISFLPREVLANWMETTSPNTVDLLQAGRHPSAKLHEAACTCACMYTNIHAHVQAF